MGPPPNGPSRAPALAALTTRSNPPRSRSARARTSATDSGSETSPRAVTAPGCRSRTRSRGSSDRAAAIARQPAASRSATTARPTFRAPKTTATGGFAATALYATSVHELTPLWRRAAEPAGAHDLAARILGPNRYAHTRGVAQQAARLARATRLERAPRSRLLAAAWLHDLGHGIAAVSGFPQLTAARAVRRAGHEPLARLVAHACGADLEAALRGLAPITRELPAPSGQDAV